MELLTYLIILDCVTDVYEYKCRCQRSLSVSTSNTPIDGVISISSAEGGAECPLLAGGSLHCPRRRVHHEQDLRVSTDPLYDERLVRYTLLYNLNLNYQNKNKWHTQWICPFGLKWF